MDILIRTCDRPDLLALELWSLAQSELPAGTHVRVIHDGPLLAATGQVVTAARAGLEARRASVELQASPQRLGVQGHAKWTAEHVPLHTWCESQPYFANLSDDCVVAPGWLFILQNQLERAGRQRTVAILSGYNAPWSELHLDQTGIAAGLVRRRHAPILGLIHADLWRTALADFDPDGTRDEQGQPAAFDGALWELARRRDWLVLSGRRSVIQHVGLAGLHGLDNPPAADGVGVL